MEKALACSSNLESGDPSRIELNHPAGKIDADFRVINSLVYQR
jgi:hypothetical protein